MTTIPPLDRRRAGTMIPHRHTGPLAQVKGVLTVVGFVAVSLVLALLLLVSLPLRLIRHLLRL